MSRFLCFLIGMLLLFPGCLLVGQSLGEAVPEEPIHIGITPERERLREKIASGINYLWYFGDWDEVARDEEYLDMAMDFGLVLLHLTNNDIDPEQVKTLRKGHDGISGTADDVLVIGYLSIGEDIRTDKDHMSPLEVGDGRGPVYWDYAKKEKVFQDNGYPSYYLDDRDKDGLPDRNWQYQGCYADPGNPDYQLMLKTGKKDEDGFVGLDELFSRYECDGVFLDTMDVVNPLGWGFPFYFEWVAPGGQKLIEQFRAWYPDKLILLNRTLVYFDPNGTQEDGTPYLGSWGKDIEDDIDLVLFEGFYWPGDEVRNRNYWAPKINAEADRTGGFTVLVLDYVGDAHIMIDGDLQDWIWNGEVQEGVEKLDDALIWSRGVTTPNEAEDCETKGIDMVDMWMANDPDNINMYMRIDLAGKPDIAAYNYYIFLDTDQDRGTGYRNGPSSLLGSDYLVTDLSRDGFFLYRYACKTGQDSWDWELVGEIPSATGIPYGELGSIELAIPKALVGERDVFDEAVDLVLFTEDASIYPYRTDQAPDDQEKDFYQYLSRTRALGFEETITRQGWLAYNKPLIGGSKVPLINLHAAEVTALPDTEPPVWDSTAASPGVGNPAAPVPRVGIQEAEPGDGSVTVRWDTARDRTRPVTYTIYYSTDAELNPATATQVKNIDTTTAGRNYYQGTGHRDDFPNVQGSPNGFYSQKVGEGVYPYEYTIDGLENDRTYYFMVRASDHAAEPNTETNSVVLSATPRRPVTRTIRLDGKVGDWEKVIPLDFSPGEVADPDTLPPEIDITEIKVTEDRDEIFFLITVEGAADFGKWRDQLSVYIDTDGDKTTGYAGAFVPTFPWMVGADYMLQNGSLYSYEPLNGYRVWNWVMEAENGKGQSRMVYTDSQVELSVKKSALGDPDGIRIAVETDRILDDGSHLIDRVPNDLFSHYYTYTLLQ